MGPFEAIVVFANAWWIVFLPILSMGTRSQEETGAVVHGTERGAPVKIGMLRKVLIATCGAALITLLVWLALQLHWLDAFARPVGS
jgi:predicted secreted protein